MYLKTYAFGNLKLFFRYLIPIFFARLKMLFVRKREKQICNERLKK
ncbi:hypothetical protein HMPREF9151_01951 [Hoylesella saccharolytica F0055]|uniref:Uncharacterized protein n=1 Tax=Hoylesella saccharolytica F0055 TaxID=1127699 RepID=L1N5H1_9BACT|nr:hypothetical protein HMPREF9151_01951 [Hoylesella saccharolytica F0055]